MAGQQKRRDQVTLTEIRAAVAMLEAEHAAGRMGAKEVSRRINNCRKAVTPRDLWKASGHRAGNRHRSDWADIRSTVFGLVSLLVMIALGVWLVTWTLAQLHGQAP
ncbi:MAG TPA: hypothetical protein VMU51_37715 [Mycobacteriales bacterium]|nr:hypothetical protein [Mycobacteriales bacterium]